ncbi:MAG: YoaK family protein [Flavobacteriaceae bacterium]
MLSSKGYERTFTHNLLLAVFFAFVAGLINVFGLINLGIFTTNLTGHVGELALSLETFHWKEARKVLFWIAAFGLGSFTSSVMVAFFEEKRQKLSYVLPIIVEILLLSWCILISSESEKNALQILILLYTMGLQNGIVSVVSGKVVRTTHLTGMVTDLGLSLGKLLMRKGNLVFVKRNITLNFAIIVSFITGGIASAFLTVSYSEKVLFIPIILLICILIYDFKTIEKSLSRMRKIREKLHI